MAWTQACPLGSGSRTATGTNASAASAYQGSCPVSTAPTATRLATTPAVSVSVVPGVARGPRIMLSRRKAPQPAPMPMPYWPSKADAPSTAATPAPRPSPRPAAPARSASACSATQNATFQIMNAARPAPYRARSTLDFCFRRLRNTQAPAAANTAPSTAPVARVGLNARSAIAPSSGAATATSTSLRLESSDSSVKSPIRYTVAKNPAAAASPPRRSGKSTPATSKPARKGTTLDCTAGLLSSSSTASSPGNADDAGDCLHRGERAPQVRHVRDLEAEAHARKVVAALRAHRGDVDALARQRFADIAQQSLSVGRRDQDIHRIAAVRFPAPLGFDQALGAALGEALQAHAVFAVHRNALAARDEAAHRIRRHRLAAPGELRHEAVDADDQDAAVTGGFGLRSRGLYCSFSVRNQTTEVAQHPLQLAQGHLVARDRREKLITLPEAEFLRDLVEVGPRGPLAPLLLFHHGAALCHGFGQ